MRKINPALITFALSLALTPAAFAFDAVVRTCHDGDTCTLADGTRVRVHAVDAPETDQPYGPQAGALINQLVAGRHVDVRPTGDRSYGRIVADMVLPDGRDVGAVMVERGYAWVETRWNNNPTLPVRERAAQAAHLGLWADANPIPPWEWRHEHEHRFFAHTSHRTWGHGDD
jgi:endonuclease YncB( thermonuclease family)